MVCTVVFLPSGFIIEYMIIYQSRELGIMKFSHFSLLSTTYGKVSLKNLVKISNTILKNYKKNILMVLEIKNINKHLIKNIKKYNKDQLKFINIFQPYFPKELMLHILTYC